MLDPISAPRASLHPVRRRDHEPPVSAEVAQSLDYQLLRRTLNPDSEITVSEAPPAASPAPSAARSSAATTSAASANSDGLTQQSQLNVTVGTAAKPQPVQQTDPLVLDLAGNGFTTRGLDDAVRFDLTGDGRPESISAPKGDDALLALDRNGNGRIDSGKELFGDQLD